LPAPAFIHKSDAEPLVGLNETLERGSVLETVAKRIPDRRR